jgi:hypothetical protein
MSTRFAAVDARFEAMQDDDHRLRRHRRRVLGAILVTAL